MRPLDVVPLTQSSASDLTLRDFGKRVKISRDYATDTGSFSLYEMPLIKGSKFD